MGRLVLRLFGGLEATLDGALITAFESAKVRALLAYLSAEADRPQRREALAGLLWPDWPQQSAMRNLRNALADLRQNIGDRDAQPPFLLVTRETIQLNREADVWVDVGEFEEAIGDRRSGTSDQQSSINNLQSVISLYRGPFLEGFSLPDSPAFEQWVLAKREYFSHQVLKALSRLVEWSLEQGEHEQAESYARRQIELEPWREQAYQQLMRMLALSGQRSAALAQYEACRKALAKELDVEPSAATKRIYEAIREEKIEEMMRRDLAEIGASLTGEPLPASFPALKSKPAPRHNLPLQLTSFIGREKEIADIKQRLTQARLLTLTGPGGTGKTRLALRVAGELLDKYEDGAWLVELAPLADPTLVPTIAARALGLRELTGTQLMAQLQDYLEHKELLLILDNCEHVIEACARLAETLLQTCPNLIILASSREALGIAGEIPYHVPPLALPEAAQSLSFEALAQYEASVCSSIGLSRSRRALASPPTTRPPSCRCASAWTASRWRSSWPRRGSSCCRWRRSPSAWTTASAC
jgi:DNA-binding SARP family transcriptional activator